MSTVFLIASLLIGVMVGSFINVLILRYGTGRSFAKGRSICLTCSREILAVDMIPIASFVMLSGKCRHCKARISTQYPLVEVCNGLLYALAWYTILPLWEGSALLSVITLLGLWAASSLLLAVFVYDLRHKIIPNGLVYLLTLVSVIFLFVDTQSISFQFPSLLHVLAGPLVALPFFLFWFVSRGTWMGLGDAKLVWSFGWVLGLSQAFTAIILGFWIGAIVAIAILLLQRLTRPFSWIGPRLSMKSEVPFAPFLIVGFFIVLFSGFNLFLAFAL